MTSSNQNKDTGHEMHGKTMHGHGDSGPYKSLAVELAADFAVMFVAMYAMIATLDHFYFNISNVYMTMIMIGPMALLMLFFMRAMYPSKQRNLVVIGLAILVFATGWYGMRSQLGVGDAQLVRSMIPHHSGAILMCREAKLSDPEVAKLCRDIIAAQEKEIGQMEQILKRL